MKLFDTTLGRLKTAMDARLVKQNVLAGNLANVDTPGYVPRELDFERAMAASERQVSAGAPAPVAAHEGHLSVGAAAMDAPAADAFVTTASGSGGGLDGNGVDLDSTMVELAKNGLLYGAAAKASAKKLGILRYVATDGVG